MAKKNKKHHAKHLPRTGSAFAVAMAMTMALSNQAYASELDENLTNEVPAPVVESSVETASVGVALPATNEAVAQANSETIDANSEAAESNQQVEADNSEAAADNAQTTDGALADPGLTLPEAPETPDTENLGDEEYNDAVGQYNDSVKDYNDAVEDYNDGVDNYNAEADAYDQQAQETFEEEKQQYEEEKAAHENAVKEYEEEKLQHDQDSADYEQYQKDLEAYQNLQKEYEEKLEQYQQEDAQHQQDSADYEQYLKDLEDYQNQQKEYEEDLTQYNQDKEQHDQDSAAYDQYLEDQKQYEEDLEDYQEDLTQYQEDSAQHTADTKAYEDYRKAQAQYETDKAAYDIAHADYVQKQTQYEEDSAKYASYQEAKTAYDTAYLEYQSKMTEYTQLQEKYVQDSIAYQNYLDAVKNFNDAKTAYDNAVGAFETEDAIYDEVTEYNTQIEIKNDSIDAKNDALENDLHANLVTSIEEVGTINQNVSVDAAVLETLNRHDELAAQLTALEEAAAALEAHTGKTANLGSDAYAAYLAAVEAYNEDVTKFNTAAESYNTAVETYNKAVDTYNEQKADDDAPSSSTGTGTQQGSADIDWGNVNFDGNFDQISEDHLTHIDVKYNAAASKEVTVETDADGNETVTYSDTVNQYTVTGVFTDKATAEAELNKKTPSYGLSYSNDGWKTSDTQALQKDPAYDEFGNISWSHTGENLDPVTGDIRFYVTLTDSAGKQHGITINMDAGSVYAKGSYYKAESNDFLENYVGKDGKILKTVNIGGVEYYDVSGESVFLISALTCDGMIENGYYTGNGWNQKFVSDGTLTAHGLDLILNLQTMIEIHQSENAQKISLVGYELGKTAQAKAPTEPGAFTEELPPYMEEPTAPTEPVFNETKPDPVEKPIEPIAPTAPVAPTEVADPGEAPVAPTAPIAPTEVADPGEAPVAPTAPIAPTEVADPGEGPVAPGKFEKEEPAVPAPTTRLEHAEKLEDLDEKVIVTILPDEPDPSPKPTVTDGQQEIPTPKPVTPKAKDLKNTMTIVDEQVPLAKAPKTGDLSGIWAMISSLSLGGMALLNRKRKEEE